MPSGKHSSMSGETKCHEALDSTSMYSYDISHRALANIFYLSEDLYSVVLMLNIQYPASSLSFTIACSSILVQHPSDVTAAGVGADVVVTVLVALVTVRRILRLNTFINI